MKTEAGEDPRQPEHSNVTGAVVDFLEDRGVETYAVRRTPTSIILSLPNEPEVAVERHLADLRGRLLAVGFERRPDIVSRDPRDTHAIIIEMTPDAEGLSARDSIVRTLHQEEGELRRRGVERLVLFGSTTTGKRHPNDVDLLVRFRSDVRLSAFDIAELQAYLEERLNRRVDLSNETTFPSSFKSVVEGTGIRIFGT